MTRRNFIRAGAALLGAGLAQPGFAQRGAAGADLHLFSKPLQWLSYDALAECLAAAGLDGIDLTVRPKGHILPENATRDLPAAVKAAQSRGLRTDMIVTAVQSADDEASRALLKTAADNGIKIYRMGYLQYDFKKGIAASLDEFRRTMEGLAKLNESLGLTGCYQNHHAWKPDLFGGVVWDLWQVLKNLDPRHIGCQYDVRHAIAESTGSWSNGTRLIAPWIRSICLKDFDLKGERNGLPYPRNTPAGEGMVPWKDYFKLLQELNVNVPATVHIEWELFSKEENALSHTGKTKLAVERIRSECDFYRKLRVPASEIHARRI